MKRGTASVGSYRSDTKRLGQFQPVRRTLMERLFQRALAFQEAASPGVPDGEAIEEQNFSLFDKSLVSNSLVVVLADDTPEFRTLKRQIEEVGGTAMIIPQRDLPAAWLRKYSQKISYCIVGHEFDDAGAAVDFCLDLRAAAPELVVILTLANVLRHDFTAERMPICEVTLRRPVSRTSLFLGLQAAADNRAAFELRHEITSNAHAAS